MKIKHCGKTWLNTFECDLEIQNSYLNIKGNNKNGKEFEIQFSLTNEQKIELATNLLGSIPFIIFKEQLDDERKRDENSETIALMKRCKQLLTSFVKFLSDAIS